MRGWKLFGALVGGLALVAFPLMLVYLSSPDGDLPTRPRIARTPPKDSARDIHSTTPEQGPEKLPDGEPPPGLPIMAWGSRDHFPVIRSPRYVSAEEGDKLLAADEPVLGLHLDKESRAYSTNQLNKHEMVIDVLDGTPVLVTY